MDGSGSIPGSYLSLTSLVTSVSLQAGDVVRVKGLQNGGVPVAYSNVAGYPGQSTENFSLLTFPHGITIRPHDATPVFIVAAGGVNPASLIRINGTSTVPGVQTLIGRLTLIGGTVGLDLDQVSGAGEKKVLVQEVTFCRNKIAASAIADGAKITPTFTDCTITDQHPILAQSPMYQGNTIGLRLHAQGLQNVGAVTASVANLMLVGSFVSVAPEDLVSSDTDIVEYESKFTRLIEIFTTGGTSEAEHPNNDPQLPPVPISEVVLAISGGSWDGAGNPDSGWALAVTAATQGGFLFEPDYMNGFQITATGVTISNFHYAGVHAAAAENTRGEVYLNGQTTIQDVGPTSGVAPFTCMHSGAHLYTFRGLLAFVATDANFFANYGHGIWLHHRGSIQAETDFPNGLYLSALRCKVHSNHQDGIAMEAGTAVASAPFRGDGIVRGTWDHYGGYWSIEYDGSEPAAEEVPQGVGQINRCAISNNGRYGISARVNGRREDDQDPSDVFSAAACRIANTILWNNAYGGFRAWLQESSTGVGSPTLLTPLVHCTIVGNGDASGYNVEMTDVNTGGSAGKFEYAAGLNPSLPTEVTLCRFNNTLFERKSAAAADFGAQSAAKLVRDESNAAIVSDTLIGIEACRFSPPMPTLLLTRYTNIDIFPLMLGSPIDWTALTASQFFLSSTGPGNEIGLSIHWNTSAPFESEKDYTDFTRTSFLIDRDFGAYQKDPR